MALVTTESEAVCCCWVPGSWPLALLALRALRGLRRDRAVQRADDAGGDGAGEAERVADGHDRLADDDLRGVADGHRDEVARRVVQQEDREVGRRVGADDLGVVGAAVVERDADRRVGAGAGGHVVVGEDVALVVDDDARALAAGLAARDGDRDDARGDGLGGRGPVRRRRVALDDLRRRRAVALGRRDRARGRSRSRIPGGGVGAATGERGREDGDGGHLTEAAVRLGLGRGGRRRAGRRVAAVTAVAAGRRGAVPVGALLVGVRRAEAVAREGAVGLGRLGRLGRARLAGLRRRLLGSLLRRLHRDAGRRRGALLAAAEPLVGGRLRGVLARAGPRGVRVDVLLGHGSLCSSGWLSPNQPPRRQDSLSHHCEHAVGVRERTSRRLRGSGRRRPSRGAR